MSRGRKLKNIFLNNYARRIFIRNALKRKISADPRLPVSKYFIDEIGNVFLHKLLTSSMRLKGLVVDLRVNEDV